MGKLLKSYIFWTHERGSFHYDVIVTLILLFMFVTPHFVNFGDKLVQTVALQSSEVLVKEAGRVGEHAQFRYDIPADEMETATTDAERQTRILRVVEPISGEVSLERYEPVKDANGKVVAWEAWVLR